VVTSKTGWAVEKMSQQVVVTTTQGAVIEGKLFCCDPDTGALVLDQGEGRYVLLNPSKVSKVEGEGAGVMPLPDVAALGVGIGNMEKREQQAINAAEKQIEALNSNVTPLQQTLFDKIASILPTKWSGNTIVILDSITLDAPYNLCVCADNSNTNIQYVQQVVNRERARLGME
jgi:hypothetical protein